MALIELWVTYSVYRQEVIKSLQKEGTNNNNQQQLWVILKKLIKALKQNHHIESKNLPMTNLKQVFEPNVHNKLHENCMAVE